MSFRGAAGGPERSEGGISQCRVFRARFFASLRSAQNDMQEAFLSNLQSNQARALPIAPALERLAHLRFGIDSQSVGDAVDVVEVGDHLDHVEDIAVGEPVPAQGLEVLRADGGRSARHKLGEFRKRLLVRREFGELIFLFTLFGQLSVFRFPTEILSVRLDSIEAMVGQETTVASISRSARDRPDGPCIVARYRSIEARKAAGFKLCTLRMLKTLLARRTALSYSVLSSPAAWSGSIVLIQAIGSPPGKRPVAAVYERRPAVPFSRFVRRS